jgi:hypothetical protein
MLQSRRALIPHFFKNTYNCSAPLGLRGGASPLRRPLFFSGIICDGNESINNSGGGVKIGGRARGGEAPEDGRAERA